MKGPRLDALVALVGEDDVVRLRVQGRPAGEEDAVLEEGLRAPLLLPPLLVEEHGRGHGGPLRVAHDGVEGAVPPDDVEDVPDGVVRGPVRRGHGGGRRPPPAAAAVLLRVRVRAAGGGVLAAAAAAQELPHRVLGRLALGEVADPREDVLRLAVAVGDVRLDEAVVRRGAEVVLESRRRYGLAGAVAEVEGGYFVVPDVGQFFQYWCCLSR